MRTSYNIKQLNTLANDILQQLNDLGYNVTLERNFANGRFGYIYKFEGGKSYITGVDNKDNCMRKLMDFAKYADEIASQYGVKSDGTIVDINTVNIMDT